LSNAEASSACQVAGPPADLTDMIRRPNTATRRRPREGLRTALAVVDVDALELSLAAAVARHRELADLRPPRPPSLDDLQAQGPLL